MYLSCLRWFSKDNQDKVDITCLSNTNTCNRLKAPITTTLLYNHSFFSLVACLNNRKLTQSWMKRTNGKDLNEIIFFLALIRATTANTTIKKQTTCKQFLWYFLCTYCHRCKVWDYRTLQNLALRVRTHNTPEILVPLPWTGFSLEESDSGSFS